MSVKEEDIIGKQVAGISEMVGHSGSRPSRSGEMAQNELTVGLTPGQGFMCPGAGNVVLC